MILDINASNTIIPITRRFPPQLFNRSTHVILYRNPGIRSLNRMTHPSWRRQILKPNILLLRPGSTSGLINRCPPEPAKDFPSLGRGSFSIWISLGVETGRPGCDFSGDCTWHVNAGEFCVVEGYGRLDDGAAVGGVVVSGIGPSAPDAAVR